MSKLKGICQVVVALILIRMILRIFLPYISLTFCLILGSIKRLFILGLILFVVYSMISNRRKK